MKRARLEDVRGICDAMAMLSLLAWELEKPTRDQAFDLLKRAHTRLSWQLIGIMQSEFNSTANASLMKRAKAKGGAVRILPIEYKSALVITPTYRVMSEHTMPNRWRRFWYWALLGWTWEKVR